MVPKSKSRWAPLLAVALAACGTGAGEVPQVGREALQADIAARLAEAGEPPRSVTCQEDLIGEPGRTARCDVVVNDSNSFQPVATVSSVDDGAVSYELAPALSQAQLEQAVRRLAVDGGAVVVAVACESGLEGAVGARAHCDVDADGVRARRVVEVAAVTGMAIDFTLLTS